MIGGGGAGGGAAATGVGQYSAGSGGGGGGYAKGTFTATQIGTSQVVTIGSGGSGSFGGSGAAGGNTSVGSLVVATGGLGGSAIAAATLGQANGGAGGIGTTGTVLVQGSAGECAFFNDPVGGISIPGVGGGTVLGGTSIFEAFGSPYGGGGSGVSNFSSMGSGAGYNGASGVAIISEYIYSPSGNTSALVWNPISGTSQTAVGNNGYYTQNAALTTITLPATGVPGTLIAIAGVGTGGWKLAQNAGQSINFGNQVTTVGTGGSITSNNPYDGIEVLVVSSTQFVVVYAAGTPTVT